MKRRMASSDDVKRVHNCTSVYIKIETKHAFSLFSGSMCNILFGAQAVHMCFALTKYPDCMRFYVLLSHRYSTMEPVCPNRIPGYITMTIWWDRIATSNRRWQICTNIWNDESEFCMYSCILGTLADNHVFHSAYGNIKREGDRNWDVMTENEANIVLMHGRPHSRCAYSNHLLLCTKIE